MTISPNFGFNRKPRLSANHLAEYLCAPTAPRRAAIIRDAKFPRKPAVAAYGQVKPLMCDFLGGNVRDLSFFDVPTQKLEAKVRRETGYLQDEARRCLAAIEAFKEAFEATRAKRYRFTSGPVDVAKPLEGVTINIRMAAGVVEESKRGESYGGGCVLFMSRSADARRNIDDRRKYVAATVHWGLEGGQMEPLPRLCISFDVFGRIMEKAPSSHERLRDNMAHSCREIARNWDEVGPPASYDGPEWN